MSSIVHIYRRFPTPESCTAHLEIVRWNGVPLCPYCGSEKISTHKEISKTRWQCSWCKKSFSVTVGTIFHNSHLDLKKWFGIIGIMNEGPISYSKAASILRIRRPTTAKMMAVITAAWDSWEVQAVLAKDEKKKWRT